MMLKKGYPHAGKPDGPYALCDCKTNIAFSPFFIVRQPSSQPIVKILGRKSRLDLAPNDKCQ